MVSSATAPASALSRRARAADALLAGALLVAAGVPSVLSTARQADSPAEVWLISIVTAGVILPLIWRRSHPIASGFTIAGFHILQLALGYQIAPANLSALFAVYALAAYAPRWAGRVGLIIAVLGSAAAPVRYGASSLLDVLMLASLMSASALAGWLLGKVIRSRRELLQQLRDRAQRLEREQLQERAIAAADERARIAREMHDIVAHSLSVIVAQADGGSYAAAEEPERARQALTTIARTGRESLGEMRRLLGVLRRDQEPQGTPVPTIADVESLLGDVRRSGYEVELRVSGEPSSARLPQGAELAAYRVVQEALTNVMKHAGPAARIAMRIDWDADGLLVSVVDDGRGAAADRFDRSGGQGIRGMMERVGLYDGTVVAQPRLGGGFEVRAHFPASGASE